MSEVQHPFQRLPVEVRQHILASLPDVHSLVSAASSCKALDSALKGYEQVLARDITINCLGPGVLPEAILALRCSPPKVYLNDETGTGTDNTEEKKLYDYILAFLEKLARPVPAEITLSIRDALAVCDFHFRVVSKLIQRFVEACTKHSGKFPLEDSLKSSPLSKLEEERIARAFYRFEIFRKLFAQFPGTNEDMKSYGPAFLSRFSPWENAQLACIHEFLGYEVSAAHNDVAKHDVVWGHYKTWAFTGGNQRETQPFLTLGLEKVLEIVACNSYEERAKVLKAGEKPRTKQILFLDDALSVLHILDMEENQGGYGTERGLFKAILEAMPFFEDGDDGSKQLWSRCREYWEDRRWGSGIFMPRDWTYRRWGFVLWDHKRLESLKAFTEAWSPHKEVRERPSVAEIKELTGSWDARSKIYLSGGRGYWAQDDTSRIVWPEGQSPA